MTETPKEKKISDFYFQGIDAAFQGRFLEEQDNVFRGNIEEKSGIYVLYGLAHQTVIAFHDNFGAHLSVLGNSLFRTKTQRTKELYSLDLLGRADMICTAPFDYIGAEFTARSIKSLDKIRGMGAALHDVLSNHQIIEFNEQASIELQTIGNDLKSFYKNSLNLGLDKIILEAKSKEHSYASGFLKKYGIHK